MSVRLCTGEYAKTGYEPEKMGIKVYSLEELCFFIRENACLLDESLMEEGLGEWLAGECGLDVLGNEIKKAVRKKISLKSFVGIILEYAHFFSPEENDRIEKTVVENSKLSVYEKKKAKADVLLQKGHLGLAGREYANLLEILPEDKGILRGEIYHSCGVCLAKMFYFELAGEYFLKAHTMTGKIASYKQYLWAKRISMSEQEYVEFLKHHEEAYEDSVEMEGYLEDLQEQWQHSRHALLLEGIRKERREKNILGYQQKLDERVEYIKDAYREMVYQPR